MMFAALALALVTQTSPPPAPTTPPTPPPTTAPSTTDAPPVVPLAPPPTTATPAAPTPPPATTPPAATPATPKPDAHAKPAAKQGLEPFSVGALQVAAGVGGCCGGLCISAVPCIGLGLIPYVGGYLADAACVGITGTAIGGVEGYVGDAFGQQRAALVWPIVASIGSLGVVAVANIVVNLVLAAQGITPPTNFQDTAAIQAYEARVGALGFVELGVDAVGTVAAIVLPAVVYGATAVDKKPGDTGQGLPGFMAPADPQPSVKRIQVSRSSASSSTRVAMAY